MRFGGKTSYRLVNRGPESRIYTAPELEGSMIGLKYVSLNIKRVYKVDWLFTQQM